jgi:spore coat protein CotF
MKILEELHNIADIGKSTKELQTELTTTEAWHIWDMLRTRYDVVNQTNILVNFVTNKDFKVVLNIGVKQLNEQISKLEKLTQKYGITVPGKSSVPPNITTIISEIDDQFVFRYIIQGIQGFLQIHLTSFIQSTNPAVRQVFKEFFIAEIEIFDKFVEYGKLNNWMSPPPAYRV